MRFLSVAGMAVRALGRRPLRGVLAATTAAVAVGVVVATRALVAGLDAALEADLGRLGVRTVQVSTLPAALRGDGPRGAPLDAADTDRARAALQEAGLRADVVEARIGAAAVRRREGDSILPFPLVEAGPDYLGTADVSVASGRFLEAGDGRAGAKAVCVLDAAAARALTVAAPGGTVTIIDGRGSRTVEVIGILEDPFSLRPETDDPDIATSARPSTAAFLAFRNVYVPRAEGAPASGLPVLLAVAADRSDASRVHDVLASALRAEERGLLVWSRGTWVRTMLATTGPPLQLVNILWGVVLMVALIMLATVGLIAVRERTGEMALRRAEGATRGSVVSQLLWEGGLVASAGALCGIPVGRVAASILSGMLTWNPVHESGEAMLAVVLGAGTGVVAAAWPAIRASALPVVEGLRARG